MKETLDQKGDIERGRLVIEAFARQLSLSPGVYRMLDKKGAPLYIGKARQLQKRVMNYTQIARLPRRLQRMVMETMSMEAVHTRTEAEALMLEANMIRKYMPRYNVLLRDDKSVPYIFISGDHPFPLLQAHRGPKTKEGDYYGPFANSDPVRKTIAVLQRVFMLRNCTDYYFAQRKRPCMQYHIKRCTAPCVGRVTQKEYGEQVKGAKQFLQGKSSELQAFFAQKMQDASTAMEYEQAAIYRDRIKALTEVQSQQEISLEGIVEDVDVIAAYLDGGQACIQVFFFRAGRNYGSKAYFPRHGNDVVLPEIIEAFMGQFYQTRPAPPEILLSHELPEVDILQEALTQENGRKVTLHVPKRGARKRIIDQAVDNAQRAHARSMADTEKHREMLEKLADLVGLQTVPERIEIYDNSHLSGTNALGVMVVVGADGFLKNQYRKFNIKGVDGGVDGVVDGRAITGGDDYAMMREVLLRRLKPLAEEPSITSEAIVPDLPRSSSEAIVPDLPRSSSEAIVPDLPHSSSEAIVPDLLVIDGGKGQLNVVQQVLQELQLDIAVIAISKGVDRNAGREWIHYIDRDPVQLEPTDPLLYFLQRIRDEAHRFAITGQRARRKKTLLKSALDSVPGIGAKRKKALLMHFGSAQAVTRADIPDLMKVEGISKAMAELIYGYFHNQK